MTQEDKKRMLDAMMQGVPPDQPGSQCHVYRELEEECTKEILALEPVIDAILERDLLAFAKFVVREAITEEGLRGIHKRFLEVRGEYVA